MRGMVIVTYDAAQVWRLVEQKEEYCELESIVPCIAATIDTQMVYTVNAYKVMQEYLS
jgi:hypothetical protein